MTKKTECEDQGNVYSTVAKPSLMFETLAMKRHWIMNRWSHKCECHDGCTELQSSTEQGMGESLGNESGDNLKESV